MVLQVTVAAGFFLLALSAQAGEALTWPPPERLVEWKPGVPGGIPAIPVTVTLKPADLPADGKTDISATLQKAVDGAPTPGAVLLPPGTFLLGKRLTLKSGVVLRGAGLDKTHLIVNAPSSISGGAIEARGVRGDRELAITAGAKLGSVQLTLSEAGGLKPGQLVWIYSDNDPELMYQKKEWDQGWAKNAMGQVVNVAAVNGAVVTLDTPLRLDYNQALNPRLKELTPVTGVGIEDLHLKREDKAEDAIIGFFYAENCWVRGCETEMALRYHVDIRCSRHVTVESCYCHHAHDYGGGGHGYGIQLSGCATDCLVQNNLLHTLRHAMIIQIGVNGCVYAYNFSFDAAASESDAKLQPTGKWGHSTDLSVHGHYPNWTLFEGNIVQRASVGDKAWGPAGPRMTLFRNRIALPEKEHDFEHYAKLGIHLHKGDPWPRVILGIDIYDYTHGVNVIGNTLTEEAALSVSGMCKDALIEGNLVGGKVQWNRTPPVPLPASLFLKAKPSFWGEKPWPCIGADVDDKTLTPLPAQDWYARIKEAGHAVPFSGKPGAAPHTP